MISSWSRNKKINKRFTGTWGMVRAGEWLAVSGMGDG